VSSLACVLIASRLQVFLSVGARVCATDMRTDGGSGDGCGSLWRGQLLGKRETALYFAFSGVVHWLQHPTEFVKSVSMYIYRETMDRSKCCPSPPLRNFVFIFVS
jgi:hypothetical protein